MIKSVLLIVCCVFAGLSHAANLVPLPIHPEGQAWPTPEWSTTSLAPEVNQEALNLAMDGLFAAKAGNGVPDTRAVLIVQGGEIVFEQYADGFDTTSRFHSWSVAKSFTNAIIGTLVHQDKLELEQKSLLPEWKDDVRIKISLRQMLNMSSGLDIGDQREDNFLGNALFGSGALDVNDAIINEPLIHDPGEHWAYSTATSTLLAKIAGDLTGDDKVSRQEFVVEHLLDPIGAPDVILTYDNAGYFLGGSHVYATAREYARLGYLYLRDGVWDGQRILPQGWVDFSRTPAPAENNGNHGAHFWLNLEGRGWQPKMLPGGPESAFVMSGNEGQYVFILPTHDMVFVRLGKMHALDWRKLTEALAAVVAAFPETQVDSANEAEVAQ